MITLQQLEFLTALERTLNFSRAAEQSFVTQPTLSAGIKELEERLGVSLVERTRQSVLFTPIGKEIVERAKDLLTRTIEIEELARAQSNPEQGEFTLGSIPTIGPYLLPVALPAIRKRFPELSLYLREELTEDLIEGVSSGRLDMALLALPFDLAKLEHIELFEDGYQLAAAKNQIKNQSRNKKGQIRELLSDGESLMLLENGHCLQRHALAAFPDQLMQVDNTFSATSLSTLVAMVSEGLGVTLLPNLAIEGGVAERGNIDLLPLPDACPRTVALAWRKSSSHGQLFGELGRLLVEGRSQLGSINKPRSAKVR